MEEKGIHIAIIPDGNRRWAEKRGKPRWWGHIHGAKKLEDLSAWCMDHPEIKTVSVYALSTENLGRDSTELNKLWTIYKDEFGKLMKDKSIKKNQLRANIIGNTNAWRADVKQAAKDVMDTTKQYTNRVLNIMLAYGSKFEIIEAARTAFNKSVKTVPSVEKLFNQFLLVPEPVDLVIRTGGQRRLSNFLLWQAAYAELYFTDTLWPDLSRKEFEKILRWYIGQKKKFGL